MADENLKRMLTQAMKTPRHFALAVKGSEVALYVSKKPVQGAMLKELKEKIGASKAYQGVCKGGDQGLMFQSTESIPTTLASPLKTHVKDEAGININPKIEKVDTLDPVVDDTPELKVEGGKSKIDVTSRQQQEMNAQATKLQQFLDNFNTQHAAFTQTKLAADQHRSGLLAQINQLKLDLKNAKAETNPDNTKIAAIDKRLKETEKLRQDHFNEWKEAGDKVKEIERLNGEYATLLQQVAAAATFEEKFELLQHGRMQAIDNVRQKMDQVYTETNRKLAILGRTVDTFEKDDSWLNKHPKEQGRVLNEGDWSMAVNDAFIKAGIDQKADFAMITRFKESVLKKIKALLMNPEGRTVDQLKQELRAFVKQEADPALFTGGRYNEGFAVSMVELEQLIDDGYVMMEHDPDGATDESAKGKDWKPTQVMVPSGKGQKIKDELGKAVEARDQRMANRKKQVSEQFAKLVAASKERIQGSQGAMKVVGLIKQALDEDNLDKAEEMLGKLQSALG